MMTERQKAALAKGREIARRKKIYIAQGLTEAEAHKRAYEEVWGHPPDDQEGPAEVTSDTGGSALADQPENKPGPGSDNATEALDIDVQPESVLNPEDAAEAEGTEPQPEGLQDTPEGPTIEVEPDPEEVEGLVDVIDVLVDVSGEPMTSKERAMWRRTFTLALRQRAIEHLPWVVHLALSTVTTVGKRLVRWLRNRQDEVV